MLKRLIDRFTSKLARELEAQRQQARLRRIHERAQRLRGVRSGRERLTTF